MVAVQAQHSARQRLDGQRNLMFQMAGDSDEMDRRMEGRKDVFDVSDGETSTRYAPGGRTEGGEQVLIEGRRPLQTHTAQLQTGLLRKVSASRQVCCPWTFSLG